MARLRSARASWTVKDRSNISTGEGVRPVRACCSVLRSEPDPDRGELDKGEVARRQLVVAGRVSYGDGAFDAVASLLVLNSVPEARRAVREMARVARPGGTVAAAVWDFRGGLTFLRVLLDTAALLDPDGEAFRARVCSFPLTAPGELGAAWAEAGLREVEETSLTVRMEFGSFADYWEPWLGGQGTVGAYVAGRTAERREGAVLSCGRCGGPGP
jgi:SAM-dependent methyltransferase